MEPTMSGGEVEGSGTALRWAEWCGSTTGGFRRHFGPEVVRSTVEETLNALLDAEADHLCGARKYSEAQRRAQGHPGGQLCTRQLHTKAGER